MVGRYGTSRPRWTFTVVLLALTALLAAGLGYQAWDASRSHAEVARSSVRGQAAFAAANFAREARGEVLFDLIGDAVEVVEDASGRRDDRPLTAERLRESVRSNRWGAAEHALVYFRLGLPDGAFTWSERADPELAEWARTLATTVTDVRDDDDDDPRLVWSAGHDELLAYERSYNGRYDAVVYGVVLAPEAVQHAFARAFHAERLLPEASTGDLGNDEAFYARVVGHDGRVLFASSPDADTEILVRHPLEDGLRDMTIELGVRDAALDQLVSGGLPESRLPFIVALLVLTSGLLGTAVWQLRREAELAALREDFISGVSHELRTPLTQIRMFGEMLLLGRIRSEEERTRAVEVIVDESTRLSHQVENILAFSRGERDDLHLEAAAVDVSTLVLEVVDAFEPLAATESVTLRAHIEPGVDGTVDADAMRQALLNVLDNALKYGPRGQTVQVGVERTPAGAARVWVEDEGPGIPDGQRERIWGAYVRLERDRASSVGGSGIGLAVVRHAIEACGGSVRAEGARHGTGARFVFELAPVAASRSG